MAIHETTEIWQVSCMCIVHFDTCGHQFVWALEVNRNELFHVLDCVSKSISEQCCSVVPGLFFSLNDNERNGRMYGRTCEKNNLLTILDFIFWIILYFSRVCPSVLLRARKIRPGDGANSAGALHHCTYRYV